jgi:hypothetical protein
MTQRHARPGIARLGGLSAAVILVPILFSSAGALRANPAEDVNTAGAPKFTFDDHARPVFREHCFSCHNQNAKKSGLSLETYAATMEGGSSGEVLFAGDLDSSRLWSLINHDDEPKMPPNQDKIPEAKLELIKKWIEGGLLENSGAKAAVAKTSSVAMAAPASTGRPENPAMPEGLLKQPVVHAARGGAVTAIASSPWAPVVAVAGQKQIILYHADSAALLGILPFEEGIPYVLRFSRNGALLLAAGGRGAHAGYAVLYDVKTGERIVKVGDELDAVLAADINDDHSAIALGGPQRLIRIYSTATGERLHEIKKHTDWIYAIRFSPDGVLLATADRSNGLFVWEAATARQYLDLRGHRDPVRDLAWRPDSNVLATASMDGSVKLWEMNDGNNIKSWNAHGGGVMCIDYTHDGRIATAGRDNTCKVWTGDGNLVKQYPGFPEIALKTTFTHDAKRLVAGDWSGEVRMWGTDDAQQVAVLPSNPPTLEMQLENAKTQHAAAAAAVAPAQAELAAAQEASAQKAAAVKAAADQAAAAGQAAEAATADTAAAQKAAEAEAAALKTAQDALAAAQASQAEDAAARLEAAKTALQKAETDKAAADQTLSAKTAAAKQAADRVAAEQQMLAKLREEQAAADNNVTAKKAALEPLQIALDAAQKQLDAANADLAAYRAKTAS